MKKFITCLFFSLVFIVVLIMLFSVPKNSFFRDKAGAYWNGGSTITFKDIDYSVNLPYNTSLNDLEKANIIKNSSFSNNSTGVNSWSTTSGGSISILDNWSAGWGVSNISSSNIGLNFNISSSFVNLFQYIHKNDLKVGYIYVTIYGNENFVRLFNQTWISYSFNGVSQYVSFVPNSLVKYSNYVSAVFDLTELHYNQNTSFFQFGVQLKTGSNVSISYFSANYYDYDYFSNSYVNNLLKSKGIYNSSYSWSTSPVMSVDYNFDTFTPDTNLYYIKNILVFNISKTLPNYLSELSSKTTFTEDVLKQLKNSYNSLSTSFPSATDLQIKNFLDIFEAIFNILVSTFKVLFYSAEVASFTGLLAFAPILDMFTYLSIVLYSSFNSWFTL